VWPIAYNTGHLPRAAGQSDVILMNVHFLSFSSSLSARFLFGSLRRLMGAEKLSLFDAVFNRRTSAG